MVHLVFSKKQQQQQHPHNTPKAHFECLMKKQQQQQPPTQKKVSKKHPQSRWFRGNDFPQTLIIAAFVAPLGICFLLSFPLSFAKFKVGVLHNNGFLPSFLPLLSVQNSKLGVVGA